MLFSLFSISFGQHPIDLNSEISSFNTDSVFKIPLLSKDQLDLLWKGEIISYLDGGDAFNTPKRGISFMLTDVDRNDLWVACQDPHFQLNRITQFHLIETDNIDRNLFYGFMDLPWPFANRHWLTLSWNNHEMSLRSEDRYWEHPWDLEKNWSNKIMPLAAAHSLGNLKTEDIDEAIFLPENQGAWVMLDLNIKRLVVYHTTGTVGGDIPENLMLRFLVHAMQDLLRDLETTAHNEIPSHYTQSHKHVYGGNGKPIPKH